MRLLVIGLLVLAGCSDPLVGEWESENAIACATGSERVRFTVDDDLLGEGGYCACTFDFTADPRGGEVYRIDINFDGPCFVSDGKYDCDLERDGERFDCGSLGDYDRISD